MPQVAISSKLTMTFTLEQWQAIEAAILAGRKIEAIKFIRELLPDAGLAEAKQYVENIETDLRRSQPEKFAARVSSGGGFGWIVAVLLLIIVVGVFLFFALKK